MAKSPWLSHPWTKILIVLLFYLVIQMGFLVVENRRLDSLVTVLLYPSLEVGDQFIEVRGTDVSNASKKVNFAEGKKLIFIYSSSCPACSRSFARWKDIEGSVGSKNVQYLSTERLSDLSKRTAREQDIAKRLLYLTSPAERRRLKISRVPQTLFVSNGKVLSTSLGELDPTEVEFYKSQFVQKENTSEVVALPLRGRGEGNH